MNLKRKGRTTLILSIALLCSIVLTSIVLSGNNYSKGSKVLANNEEKKKENNEATKDNNVSKDENVEENDKESKVETNNPKEINENVKKDNSNNTNKSKSDEKSKTSTKNETTKKTEQVPEKKLTKEGLEKEIHQYLGNNINKVGLVYYDISSGDTIAINGDKKFLAASTVKVQINMITYDNVREGKLKLTDELLYTSSEFESGTGILQNKDKSKPIPIQTLLDYSIKYSDNIATNMIRKNFGGSTAMRKMVNNKFGLNMDTSDNYITPNGEFKILKNLYDNRNDKNYAHLINVMKNTVFHDRIDKYIPRSICAHKIGTYGSYISDVGIIYTNKPYILVIYTNRLSNASESIAKVSQIVYNYQKSK